MQKLRQLLDNAEFEFEFLNGETFNGTIKQFNLNSIINWKDTENIKGILHNTQKESAIDILKNGLNWKKTSRKHFGPGTYFSMVQDITYGKAAVEGNYIGEKKKYPVLKERYYEAILNNNKLQETLEENGFDVADLDEYCHEILTKDLGIDILYGGGRSGGCFVALDNDCLKLKPYNFEV